MIIPYASRTGTKRNLAALRDAGWRLLVSAKGVHRTEGFRYAIDNGAWTAFQSGEPFDCAAFECVVAKLGHDADWIVAPDIVSGGLESLEFSLSWMPRLEAYRVLLAVQDGMQPYHVRDYIGDRVGVFIGGSTEFKLSTMPDWGSLCQEMRAHLHVGRVNSAKRIHLCRDSGAHSFDGTSATRFAKSLPRLDRAARQGAFFDPDTSWCGLCDSGETEIAA